MHAKLSSHPLQAHAIVPKFNLWHGLDVTGVSLTQ